MKNRINEILEANINDIRKVGLLCACAREAFDRNLLDLSKEYETASNSILKDGKPYKRRDPYSQTVFYANKPQVIIFREKHGDWIFDASTPENAARACLYVLAQRLDEGHWYFDELEEGIDPVEQFDLFKSNVKPLTDVERATKILEIGREHDGLIAGGKKAFEFLMFRTDYEYERMEVEIATIAEFN